MKINQSNVEAAQEITISYAVTVKDELEEIQQLIPYLIDHKQPNDEIIVLWDNKGSIDVLTILRYYEQKFGIKLYEDEFQGHFADWKNYLTSLCSGDFIFQIDADEIPNEGLMRMIHWLIHSNKEVDVFLIPRENFVEGITKEYIEQNKWVKDEYDRINYPDFQWRIYRNSESIKWVNKDNEYLEGFKEYTYLPTVREYGLNHIKQFKIY